ncbi:MAG: zinc-ribbon domain-containing protein, partial [Prevotella sp.]
MRYCKNCGAPLDNDALFCRECGTKVEVAEQVAAPQPPAPQIPQPQIP